MKVDKFVGVIGLGNISDRHRANIRHLFPEVKIIVMSASGKSIDLKDVSDADGFVTDIEQFKKYQPWFVVDASPATMHPNFSGSLLKMGIPVLTEKPIAGNLPGAKLLENTQKETGTYGAVAYCLRFEFFYEELKKIIDQDILGDIYNVYIEVGQFIADWRPNKNYLESVSTQKNLGGGVLLELSHEIDYAISIFGSIKHFHSNIRSSNQLKLEVEDLADLFIVTHNDVVVNVHLDMLQKTPTRTCRVVGKNGELKIDLINKYIRTDLFGVESEVKDYSHVDPNHKYLILLENFVHSIDGEYVNNVTYSEGVEVMSIVEEAKVRQGYL